jgi:hypothetical protein
MGRRLKDLQCGRAISAIALQYHRERGKPQAWKRVTEWAEREFRYCSKQTIKAAVERAKEAVKLAERVMNGDDDYTFNHTVEKRRQE